MGRNERHRRPWRAVVAFALGALMMAAVTPALFALHLARLRAHHREEGVPEPNDAGIKRKPKPFPWEPP